MNRGFSLLELAVAVTVLGIALVGVVPLLTVALQNNDLSRSSTVVTEIARGKFEELKWLYQIRLKTGHVPDALTEGTHGPETVELGAPQHAEVAARSFLVSWEIVDLGLLSSQVAVTVRPLSLEANSTHSKTDKVMTITGAFAP